MDETSLKELAELMSVLGVESRLRIVTLLMECESLCVNALASSLGISQSAVSQHLRILHLSGLVSSERDGYYTHYSLNRDKLRSGLELLDTLNSKSATVKRPECEKKGSAECAEAEKNAGNRKN